MTDTIECECNRLETLMREYAMSIECNYDDSGNAYFQASAYVDQDTITRKGASLYGVVSECIEAASKIRSIL